MSTLAPHPAERISHTTSFEPSVPPCKHRECLGLVTCAISVRRKDFPPVSAGRSRFYFPTADECRSGAQSVGSWEWNGREGIVPQIEVAPGLIRLTAPDLNRREKTLNRAADQPGMTLTNDDDQARMDAHRAELEGLGVLGDDDPRMITGWSRRSRARMVSSMAELDLAPLLMGGDDPAMITLTYPGDWEVVAPDGEAVKAHLQAFFKRFARAWGRDLVGIWKMEFQRRGAPHFHLLMSPPSGTAGVPQWVEYQVKANAHPGRVERFEQVKGVWVSELSGWVSAGGNADEFEENNPLPPKPRKPRWVEPVGYGLMFREWLSVVWADIVGHPDVDPACVGIERELSGEYGFEYCQHEGCKHRRSGTRIDYSEGDRARDPKRAAIYFGKHGSFAAKDYQHDVPELWKESGKSVGRFWGYRGLSKVKGAATLDVDTMIFLGRVLRGYGTRTRVLNPVTGSHDVRPVLVTKVRARRTVSADGTVKQARDKVTGELLFDDEGNPVDHVRLRKTTVRAKRMTGKNAAGFLLVNDGPGMARVLARAIESCRGESSVLPVGMRGPVVARVG